LLLTLLASPLAASWCGDCALVSCLQGRPQAATDPAPKAAPKHASETPCHGAEPARRQSSPDQSGLSAVTRADCCGMTATPPAELAVSPARGDWVSPELAAAPTPNVLPASLRGAARKMRDPPRSPSRPLFTLNSTLLL
jgi:hypothetical protein